MNEKDLDKFLARKRRIQRQKEKKRRDREDYDLPAHIGNKLKAGKHNE